MAEQRGPECPDRAPNRAKQGGGPKTPTPTPMVVAVHSILVRAGGVERGMTPRFPETEAWGAFLLHEAGEHWIPGLPKSLAC